MIHKLIAFVCIASLAIPAAAQNSIPTIPEQVSRMKQGSSVSVTSKNGNVINGRLLSSTAASMDIQPNDKKAAPMSIAYQDVQSVQRHGLTHRQKKWIIISAVAGGAVVAFVVACNSVNRHPYDSCMNQ